MRADRLGTLSTSTTAPRSRTPSSLGEAPARAAFVTTHWSAVLAAGRDDSAPAHAALEHLCRDYWQPLYAFVRRAGYARPDAQDLTQAFFAHLLARKTVALADPARGRFRSFLLTSLKNFLAHAWEKARTEKRGGRVQIMPLEFDTAETRCAPELATTETPDRAFDRQWAISMLEVVLGRLRQEYAACGRDDLFVGVKESLSGGRADIPYRDLGIRLGMSEGAVKVAAHRLRRRYRELLREEIARTVSDPAEGEAELRHLFAALNP